MFLLENIINLANVDPLQDFNCQSIENLPIHVFVKDLNGKYLNCNDLVAKTTGLKKREDLLGLHDHELCWKDIAAHAVRNDRSLNAQPDRN